MKNIECIVKEKVYNITIDKYKIIFGQKFDNKFEVYKCIKSYFNKTPMSEYSKENNGRLNVKLNGNYLDVRDTLFLEVGYEFDYSSDAKLTTKSLILKYLECLLEDIEYEDSFNTIKELLYAFINVELADILEIDFKDLSFGIQNEEFSYKSLIKLVTPILSKEELEVNNNDMEYEDLIILQLKIINKIARKNYKNIIVLANTPYITRDIIKELNLMNENVAIIVFSNNYIDDVKVEDLILSDLEWLDLGNEEQIYDFLFNSPFTNSIESFKSRIKEVLNNCSLYKLLYNKK